MPRSFFLRAGEITENRSQFISDESPEKKWRNDRGTFCRLFADGEASNFNYGIILPRSTHFPLILARVETREELRTERLQSVPANSRR